MRPRPAGYRPGAPATSMVHQPIRHRQRLVEGAGDQPVEPGVPPHITLHGREARSSSLGGHHYGTPLRATGLGPPAPLDVCPTTPGGLGRSVPRRNDQPWAGSAQLSWQSGLQLPAWRQSSSSRPHQHGRWRTPWQVTSIWKSGREPVVRHALLVRTAPRADPIHRARPVPFPGARHSPKMRPDPCRVSERARPVGLSAPPSTTNEPARIKPWAIGPLEGVTSTWG